MGKSTNQNLISLFFTLKACPRLNKTVFDKKLFDKLWKEMKNILDLKNTISLFDLQKVKMM